MAIIPPAPKKKRGSDTLPDGDGRVASRQRSGQNFALTFSYRCKYQICKKLFRSGMVWTTEAIDVVVVGDETGEGYMPNAHTHAYVKTHDKKEL